MQLLYVKHKVLVVVFKKKNREPKRSVTNINLKKKKVWNFQYTYLCTYPILFGDLKRNKSKQNGDTTSS